MSHNTQLPVEVTDEIKLNAEDFANSHINGRSQPDVWEIVFKAHETAATAYATKLQEVEQENEQLKEALQEAFTTMEWMWDNMRPADEQTLLQIDVFNRPANALNIIEQVFSEVKRTKHNNTFIDGE